jgi:F-type H+-transporting ATPase subunit b
MESVLAQLGGLLLRALPTFLLVLALHFYLKLVFFKPLQRVLDARYQATEGARKKAEASLEKAAAKASEYEQAMRAARAEVYAAQERLHRELEEQRKNDVAAARERAEQLVAEAKAALAGDVEEARRTLARETEELAERIAQSILGRRAA